MGDTQPPVPLKNLRRKAKQHLVYRLQTWTWPAARRPNKVTQELGEAARAYTADALATLHHICMHGEIDAARVSAALRSRSRPWEAKATD